MATNLSVDPDLIEQARKVSGERTSSDQGSAGVHRASEPAGDAQLAGKLEWDAGYDYKKGCQ